MDNTSEEGCRKEQPKYCANTINNTKEEFNLSESSQSQT